MGVIAKKMGVYPKNQSETPILGVVAKKTCEYPKKWSKTPKNRSLLKKDLRKDQRREDKGGSADVRPLWKDGADVRLLRKAVSCDNLKGL